MKTTKLSIVAAALCALSPATVLGQAGSSDRPADRGTTPNPTTTDTRALNDARDDKKDWGWVGLLGLLGLAGLMKRRHEEHRVHATTTTAAR